MPHIVQGAADDGTFFPIDEKASVFGFGCCGCNMFQDAGGREDGSVVQWGISWVISEGKMATRGSELSIRSGSRRCYEF